MNGILRYELSQIQRGLERKVRKYKQYLAEDAAGLDSAQRSVKLKTARKQLKQFTYETCFDLDSARTGVSGFGQSQASKATWAVRKQEIALVATRTAEYNKKEEIREVIRSDVTTKALNNGNQNKHIRDSKGYIAGRSYIYGDLDTAQELVDRYSGHGEIKLTDSGEWTKKEFVVADHIIGVVVDPETGMETETRRFSIHYGKNGIHSVLAKEVIQK